MLVSRCAQLTIVTVFFGAFSCSASAEAPTNIPVHAPVDTESAGRAGDVATHAVIRLICDRQTQGTGFLHKSGHIITAAHVVHGCKDIATVLPDGTQGYATAIAQDTDLDLALVKPGSPIKATPLALSAHPDFKVGTQVSTWGFPTGYFGFSPLLSVGYLAGKDAYPLPSGKVVTRWIVNAAFNSGNSGGPLIHIETGEVFGVVSSKLAPLSPYSVSILSALEHQGSGFAYTATDQEGKQTTVTEGQIVGHVLNELRNQVQLVIGQAVLLEDLQSFLRSNKIEP